MKLYAAQLPLESFRRTEGKETECQLFQRGKCHYGEQCKYLHVIRTESGQLFDCQASSTRGTDVISLHRKSATTDVRAISASLSRGRNVIPDSSTVLPLRQGAADCLYYLKTGKCNYGSRCKFNHPFRDENLVNALNRRDCFDFVQTGMCPYGKTCKYNHPTTELDVLTSVENKSSSSCDSPSFSTRYDSKKIPRRSASEPRYSMALEFSERSMSHAQASSKTGERILQTLTTGISSSSPRRIAKNWANEGQDQGLLCQGRVNPNPHNFSKAFANAWPQNAERCKQPEEKGHQITFVRPVRNLSDIPLFVRPGEPRAVSHSCTTAEEASFSPGDFPRKLTEADIYAEEEAFGWTSYAESSRLASLATVTSGFPAKDSRENTRTAQKHGAQLNSLHGSIGKNSTNSLPSQGENSIPKKTLAPNFKLKSNIVNGLNRVSEIIPRSNIYNFPDHVTSQSLDWTPDAINPRVNAVKQVSGSQVPMPLRFAGPGNSISCPPSSAYVSDNTRFATNCYTAWTHESPKMKEKRLQELQHLSKQQGMQQEQFLLPHQEFVYQEQRLNRSLGPQTFLSHFPGRRGLSSYSVGNPDLNGSGSITYPFPKERKHNLSAEFDVYSQETTYPSQGRGEVSCGDGNAGINELENFSNLWKPSEKSSMFGPGLFRIRP